MRSHRFIALTAILVASSSLTALAQSAGTGSGSGSNPSNSSGSANSNNSGNNSNATGGLGSTGSLLMATDPGYRLSIGDEITISIHGEDDMSAAQRIDKKGGIRMPILNEVNLSNKTVREAESFIEQLLVEKKLLRSPLVNITVRDYATREVTVIGAVGSPGLFRMRREADSVEILELVMSVGGLRGTAKGHDVKVIRTDDEGRETTQTVNVEAMINGKKDAKKSFLIYPGDRIIVDERMW